MKIQEAFEYQNLYTRLKNEPLNIRLAYKLNKLNSKIITEVSFYEENINKILNKYAQKDENGLFVQNELGTGILIQPDFLETCHREINELQNIEFEISGIEFNLDELSDLKITPAELACLDSLIVE